MAYQSLYRRYRPRRFAEVRGQEHVVTALRNAVREGRVSHAYLFSGPRGTGKTTSARVLAKVLNCENPNDGEPCLECPSCVAVEAGASFDLHELDAASNNKVDDIRELIERVAYSTPGRTKVYILDEVHMLTAAASAALLKTLEEPPPGVVFVLATTDPQKVLPTIRSRTQHFDFHLLPAAELEDHVRWVVKDAGLDVDDAAIAHALREGGGSARDTLSALDQVAAAGGLIERGVVDVDAIVDSLAARDSGAALVAVAGAVAAGRDAKVLAEELVGRIRDVFLAALGADLSHLGDGDRVRAADVASRVERAFLTRALELLGEALIDMRQAPDARIALEVALVRIAEPVADTTVAALAERLERLERAIASGGTPAPPAGGAGSAPAGAAPAASAPPASETPSGRPSPAADARRQLRAQRESKGAPRGPSSPSASQRDDVPAASVAVIDAPAPILNAPITEGDEPPDRDQLTLAWGDAILGSLPRAVKALFAAGRFVGAEGGAALMAMPNAVHRDRCQSRLPDVEAALEAHFGRRVRLRLVVEGSTGDTASVPVPEEESVDVRDLVDVPADGRSGLERLADAFPGSELIEDPE